MLLSTKMITEVKRWHASTSLWFSMSPFTVNANTPTIIAGWASLWVVPHCQYLHVLPAIEEVRHLLPTPTLNMSATLKKLTLSWPSRNRKKEKPWDTLFKIVLNAHLWKHTWWEQHVTLIHSCFCSWWASTFDVCWSEHVRHFTGRPCALTTGTTMDLFLASIHHSRLLLTAAKKLSIQFAHHKVLTATGYREKRASFQLSCCCWLLRVRFSDPKMTLAMLNLACLFTLHWFKVNEKSNARGLKQSSRWAPRDWSDGQYSHIAYIGLGRRD